MSDGGDETQTLMKKDTALLPVGQKHIYSLFSLESEWLQERVTICTFADFITLRKGNNNHSALQTCHIAAGSILPSDEAEEWRVT